MYAFWELDDSDFVFVSGPPPSGVSTSLHNKSKVESSWSCTANSSSKQSENNKNLQNPLGGSGSAAQIFAQAQGQQLGGGLRSQQHSQMPGNGRGRRAQNPIALQQQLVRWCR